MSGKVWMPTPGGRIMPGCQDTHLYEADVAAGRMRRWYQPGTQVVFYFPADDVVEPVRQCNGWISYRTILPNGDVVETNYDPAGPPPKRWHEDESLAQQESPRSLWRRFVEWAT